MERGRERGRESVRTSFRSRYRWEKFDYIYGVIGERRRGKEKGKGGDAGKGETIVSTLSIQLLKKNQN